MIDNMLDQKKTQKIVAVLPCRIFSTRLFAKPLQQINNYEILLLLISQLKKSSLLNKVILAISNDSGSNLYVDFAKKLKIPYVLGSESDVLGRLIKGVKKINGDVLLRVTPENPYIYWEGIDSLIRNHLSGNYDLTFYKNLPIGASYEIVNLKSLEIAHKLGKDKHRSEYSTLYFFENQNKFSINPILPKKSLQFPKIRLTVDTPEDLIVARIIHDKFGMKTNPIKLEKIINFLNSNKKIMRLNSNVSSKYKRYV